MLKWAWLQFPTNIKPLTWGEREREQTAAFCKKFSVLSPSSIKLIRMRFASSNWNNNVHFLFGRLNAAAAQFSFSGSSPLDKIKFLDSTFRDFVLEWHWPWKKKRSFLSFARQTWKRRKNRGQNKTDNGRRNGRKVSDLVELSSFSSFQSSTKALRFEFGEPNKRRKNLLFSSRLFWVPLLF